MMGIVCAIAARQNIFKHGEAVMRHYSPIDQLLIHADTALRTLLGKPLATHRPYPADDLDEGEMDSAD